MFGKRLNWAVEFALDHLEKSQQIVPISQVVQEYLDQKIRKGVSSFLQTALLNFVKTVAIALPPANSR